MPGISPSEIWDRAQSGPKVDVKDYNFKILSGLTEKFVKEYDIKINKDSITPIDNSLADSIYQAGYQLLLENGIYCTDTSRMIKISDSEIKNGIMSAPTQITVGEGRDTATIVQRRIGDSRRPLILCGCEAIPVSEDIYVKATQSYAQETNVDMIVSGSLPAVEGHEIAPHSPFEIKAAQLEGRMCRLACSLAGRPGMGLLVPMTPATPEARIAAEKGQLRSSDLHQVSIVSELKIGLDSITVVADWLQANNLLCPEAMPIFGGYVGGSVERMAVLDVAAHLASFTLLSASIHDDGPIHVRWGCTTTRETIQMLTHVGFAIDRNTNLLTQTMNYPRAGPSTETIGIELAAQAIADTVSGREVLEGVGANQGATLNHVDGLLGRMLGKISIAAAKLNPSQASEITNILLKQYGNKDYYKSSPYGKSFQECFDITSVKPKDDHLKVYQKTIEELEEKTGLKIL